MKRWAAYSSLLGYFYRNNFKLKKTVKKEITIKTLDISRILHRTLPAETDLSNNTFNELLNFESVLLTAEKIYILLLIVNTEF